MVLQASMSVLSTPVEQQEIVLTYDLEGGNALNTNQAYMMRCILSCSV